MDILFAATELAPYAKVGGLADVVAALTKTLRQHGHNVSLVLPRFPHFERAGLLVARKLTPLTFDFAGANYTATVYDGRLPSGVDITLLDLPGFDRDGIYGEAGKDYEDNAIRFALFSRAVVEMIRQRLMSDKLLDIVHVNDWTTALVPLFAKRLLADELHASTRFIMSLHNLAHQGVRPASDLSKLGIPQDLFHPEGVEFYGKVNILKAGLIFSDAITTVSSTYAREILTANEGRGLEGVLGARASRVTGIVNGIDYSLWNPATDPHIAARYHVEEPMNKARCKTALLTEVGLEMVPERPVAALVGRLVDQKGIDLLLEALPKIIMSDVGLVVAGDGEDALAQQLAAASEKFPGRIAFARNASDSLVHRIFAGADIVLVPSRFEPCGVVQLYGQRYGAVPVAHATGGLIDTIVDCDPELETGTGFLFEEPTSKALLGALQRALAAHASPRWPTLRRRVMDIEVGWDRPAQRYAQLYRTLVG